MKVVIMAGGKGTRISSVASDIPKPMIKIEGTPVLEREIECLKEQGFDDILITVSHLGNIIMDYFGDGSGNSPVTGQPFGVHIEYYFEREPLGNAGALFKIKDKLTEDFLLLNSMILKYMKIQNLKMSSGERAFLNMMSRIYFSAHIREFLPDKSFQWEESILLIIDEIDLYLHPEWQRIIVSELLNIVKDQFPNNYFQIIVTSHSPIVLSDIPIENSIYLDRNADGLTRQVQRNEQTFGANIHALYQNAFFLNDGLAMGKFAQERINIWIEEAEKANPQKMKQIINMIGEPLICRELRKIIGRRQETIREKAKNEEHMMMLRFLKQQKAEIERQIKILEEEYSD